MSISRPMSEQREMVLREAEKNILGFLLIYPREGGPVAEEMLGSGAPFFCDPHRIVYRKIYELGASASIETVVAGLKESRALASVGGSTYLSGCMEAASVEISGFKKSIRLVLKEQTIRTGQRAAEDYLSRVAEDPDAARIALLKQLEKATIPGNGPAVISASDLMRKELGPTRWAIPGLIPDGLTLLAGKPKIGKSWLSLGLAVAVASGGRALGKIQIPKGSVLYLALEDTDRRLQKRLLQMLGDEEAPPGLSLATIWPRTDAGGLEQIEAWIRGHRDARLVLIDTLVKLRPEIRSSADRYAADYATAGEFKALSDRYGIPIVGVCHDRKAEAVDWIDRVNATTGLSGAADSILLLERPRGSKEARLHGTGRDLEEEIDLALNQDPIAGGWVLLGDAQTHLLTPAQKELVDVLSQIGHPAGPAEIANATGRNLSTVKSILRRTHEEGKIGRLEDGRYYPLHLSTNTTEETDATDTTDATAWLRAANVAKGARVAPVA